MNSFRPVVLKLYFKTVKKRVPASLQIVLTWSNGKTSTNSLFFKTLKPFLWIFMPRKQAFLCMAFPRIWKYNWIRHVMPSPLVFAKAAACAFSGRGRTVVYNCIIKPLQKVKERKKTIMTIIRVTCYTICSRILPGISSVTRANFCIYSVNVVLQAKSLTSRTLKA